MGWFDRFTSRKGKAVTAKPKGKAAQADEVKQQAFASVPASEKPAAKKAEGKTAAPAKAKEATGEAFRLLLRPIVTEKSAQAKGQYTFEVARTASKTDVRDAIVHTYGIKPTSVNILNQTGKFVRYGRSMGRTIKRRKAMVTLPAGKTIDVFSA